MNKFILTVVFISISYNAFNQNSKELKQYEDSIVNCFDKLLNYQVDSSKRTFNNQTIKVVNKRVVANDSVKLNISYEISDLFNQVLKNPKSFSYSFSKLKHISNLKSADSLVRIITWNIPMRNGSYKYFGFVQRKNEKDNTVDLFKLTDASEKIKKPEYSKLKPSQWFGAIYYKLQTNYQENKAYYTLLGWDGNNRFTTKKIIECFSFNKGKLIFGMPIFKMAKDIKNRVIFEYTKQVSMMLRFDKKLKMIVFDHLAPSHEKFTGQYMYYGPDMSQDGIKFEKGYWILYENLNLKNKNKVKLKKMPKSY